MMRQTHDSVANDRDPFPEVKRLVGTIAELWRYPVKSMLGGTVSELMVTERGVLGDRAWALRDQRTGRIVSAKRVPRLLQFRATYEVEPTLESAGLVGSKRPMGTRSTPGRKMPPHAFRAFSAARYAWRTPPGPTKRRASAGTRYSVMSLSRR